MSHVDGLMSRYQELADAQLERYQRAVEESDAAEVTSFMSVLIYQHLETRGHIETFMAARYQEPADIVDDARCLVEQELVASVEPDKTDLILPIAVYAMREVDWVAVAEVIFDEIGERRRKLRHLGGHVPPVPWIVTRILGPDDDWPLPE